MNSQFPNSPEDRLLDELLREQAHGPDEAFLQQIEKAVDAGLPLANKLPAPRHYGRLAIAAGVALAAGSFVWFSLQNLDQHAAVSVADRKNTEKEKAALEFENLTKSIREQEDNVEERRKVLATIVARPASGDNMDVLPSLIGKLRYVKDESLAWVLRPGYGVDGRFPINYEDSSRQTKKTGAANPVAPGESFFLTGPMANRFKLLGSEVRREMSKAISIERDVVIVRIEDQRPNKKGMVYEFPSPLAEDRKNEFVKYDRTAVFSLEATGMEGKEFKVEENTVFSLPPGGEKKDYLLKSVTPAGVVVEMVDGGQMVEISKGAMPAGEALAALAKDSAGSPRGDTREDAIKRELDTQDYFDAKKDFEADQRDWQSIKRKLAVPKRENGERSEIASNVRVIRHQDGSESIFTRDTVRKVIIKKTFDPNGILTMRATYRIDDKGNPLGCKIVDGQNQELFTVRYGYLRTTGQLVEELMFDSRVKRADPDTGKEMPVQKVNYLYDAAGKRSAPVIFNYGPGQAFEQAFGQKSSAPDSNLFSEAGEAEVIPGNQGR